MNPWELPSPDPDRTHHARASARGKRITQTEREMRKRAMVQAVTNLLSRDDIHALFRDKFNMTRGPVEKLRKQVEEELLELDRETLGLSKQKAIRRIATRIAKAEKAGAWTAVMAGEQLLAKIQGTLEPVQVHVNVDATVREAVTVVLAQMPPAELEALLTDGVPVHELPQAPDPEPAAAE